MVHTFPVLFTNGDTSLAGRFYRNTAELVKKEPAILVTGSWLTVKEQMAETYARVLAELGYTAFTFDFACSVKVEARHDKPKCPRAKSATFLLQWTSSKQCRS